MIPESEIVSAALRIVRDHGEDAARQADKQAAQHLRDGDAESAAMWQRIAAKVRDILADDPVHWFGTEALPMPKRRPKRRGDG